MKFLHRLLLGFSSSVLLWAAWPAGGFAPFLFVALVPLLIAEEYSCREKKQGKRPKFFLVSYSSMLLFNLFTTWWIYFASTGGMLLAVIFNALFMAGVFQIFHYTKLKLGRITGYGSLIVYWLAFEYVHHNWVLSYPWLTLGNGFAAWADMVQWYEFTGVLGGSAWILVLNCAIAHFLILYIDSKKQLHLKQLLVFIPPVLFIPLFISFILKEFREEKRNPLQVVVVQPNIDPYNEKFSGLDSHAQLDKMLKLAKPLVSESTDYIVCPETALPQGIWEEALQEHPDVQTIREFIKPFPRINFITGLSSNKIYFAEHAPTKTARKFQDSEAWYDSYNTGMQLSSDTAIQLHHKSKLVIGVEVLPFSSLLGFIEKYAIDLGGASGSLGTQETPSVFKSSKAMVAPVICYESVYGEYVTEYIKQGAQAIFIITNDGWWNDTPGYRQHCQYARLRAIETRRAIARSANTGTSCFIDQLGDITQPTKWWTPIAIEQTIQLNDEHTFYARHGDYLGKIASLAAIILLTITFFKRKRQQALN